MTVIAVKVEEDKVTIASDSQTTYGYRKHIKENTTKLTRISDDFIVGSSGLAKVNQLLELFCETVKPKNNSNREIIRFFKSFEAWLDKEASSKLDTNNFLFILDKKVFHFDEYYLLEIKDYYAIGSGSDYALVALELGQSAERAVQSACKLDIFCNEPVKTFEVLF